MLNLRTGQICTHLRTILRSPDFPIESKVSWVFLSRTNELKLKSRTESTLRSIAAIKDRTNVLHLSIQSDRVLESLCGLYIGAFVISRELWGSYIDDQLSTQIVRCLILPSKALKCQEHELIYYI